MRSTLPALLLAVALVTAGCASVLGPDRPPSDPRATDAVNRSVAASADVQSYRFTVDADVSASKGDRSMRVDMTGAGRVDVAGQRMHVTTESDGETRETYVDGTASYTECPRFGWTRQNISSSARWLNYTPVGQQLALLQRTDVYYRGNGTVDGADAVVVEAYPTKGELQSVAEAQRSEVAELDGANIQNVTVTVWIDRASGRLLKAERYIKLKRSGATAEATVTFRFTDYEEPVTVDRPEFDGIKREVGC